MVKFVTPINSAPFFVQDGVVGQVVQRGAFGPTGLFIEMQGGPVALRRPNPGCTPSGNTARVVVSWTSSIFID